MFNITSISAQSSKHSQESRKWLGSKQQSGVGDVEEIHQAAQCYLNAKCQQCHQTHLEVLHDVNSSTVVRPERPAPEPSQPVTYYLDPTRRSSCVLLKMVKVCLYNGKRKIETYAILDDRSECTILLHSATQELGLQ